MGVGVGSGVGVGCCAGTVAVGVGVGSVVGVGCCVWYGNGGRRSRPSGLAWAAALASQWWVSGVGSGVWRGLLPRNRIRRFRGLLRLGGWGFIPSRCRLLLCSIFCGRDGNCRRCRRWSDWNGGSRLAAGDPKAQDHHPRQQDSQHDPAIIFQNTGPVATAPDFPPSSTMIGP